MSALIARFGEEGGRLHARARGQETEPFRARRATKRLALALPIEPPVEDLEPLRFVLHRLVAGLTAQLTARGLAADRAILALELDLAFAPNGTEPRIEVEQRFPEPTADAEAVERLLFARLEREPPPAAVQRLELELRGTTPAAGQQLPLFVPQAARTATARLAARTARADLRGGSGQAGRDQRPGSAASRGPLELARRRSRERRAGGLDRVRPGHDTPAARASAHRCRDRR